MNFKTYSIVLIVTFAILAGFHQLYSKALLYGCWAGGYSQNAWMAYCDSGKYGVFDADAIWFGAEPGVAQRIAESQVLTISDSHLQNALSLGGASEWFSAQRIRAYFLGMPTLESGFGELLWQKFKPHPSVVIFDASPYFTGSLGQYQILISDTANQERQSRELEDFQRSHQAFCLKFPWACGHNFAYFKSRDDGRWIFPDAQTPIWAGRRSVPNDATRFETRALPDEEVSRYPAFLAAARGVVAGLHMPLNCIVMTHVPDETSSGELAHYLADSLGVVLIDPSLPPLSTFDHSHLTPASSRQWTQAFLDQLTPILRSCLPHDG